MLGRSALCAVLATLVVEPPLQLVHAQDGDGRYVELTPEARAAIQEELVTTEAAEAIRERTSVDVDVSSIPDEEDIRPLSLPGVEARTAVTPQAISLPSGEGSVEGMGESFAPVLSSGTATYTVPIRVVPGRAGVQPSLALAYSSSGGNSPVGFGWAVAAPFIARQTDRGLPLYLDEASWHAQEDRFIYNGGQELVPVSSAAIAAVDGEAAGASASAVPADVSGWQQYRARVEGSFMRFFRSPDGTRWVVQSRDGTRFDFGVLPSIEGPSGINDLSWRSVEMDPESTRTAPRVFRWNLTRSSDAHGSTIYYSYVLHEGQSYLSEIHYISPASCASASSPELRRRCSEPLSSYAARVRLVYEERQDVFDSYASGWRVSTGKRLRRIEVTAREPGASGRTLVRRYHLRYDAESFHSLLAQVQLEGRPDSLSSTLGAMVGAANVPEDALGDGIVGRVLPPMTFGYTEMPSSSDAIVGFGGVDGTVRSVAGSPPHSVDDAIADLFDVNSDGLPDLVVTDPARFRASGDRPAVGVYFNGFSGSSVQPASAGTFSGAVSVPMRPDLASTLSLSNPNVVPMDIDGDGRSDLLHMPRSRSYGWFTPMRDADPTAGGATSPAAQGWRWAYARVDLPSTDVDPRIDLGRDAQNIQILDVNNDHLIDVVRTTGTSMQTWVNLGWLPAGDGRFGSYRWTGSRWELSTVPFESCLLNDGRPLDFEDSEIRFADMNGDGLQDIVRVRRDRISYWPGRGIGVWGDGPLDCTSVGDGVGRHRLMTSPPRDLAVDLSGVSLVDVNADGASDLVQVRFDAIDVWFNRAGQSWTSRITIRGTPPTPSFASTVRHTDIDGSGTTDIVWGVSGAWRYVDLAGGQRPRLLTSVDNGLGAFTEIEYGSSARDYLEDLADADACTSSVVCERFTWGAVSGSPSARIQRLSGDAGFRSAGSPVISTVVRRIRTSDRFSALGRPDQVSETRFAYHEGYYEGIEQEFRGFGAADAQTVGDSNSPDVFARTFFQQGRRPQEIADDRLADNPEEALKGREYLTESFDAEGRYLSSSHATLATRDLVTGLDGRAVRYAFVQETNELRYDHTPFAVSTQTITLDDVRFESWRSSADAFVTISARPRVVRVRGQNWARIRTTWDDVDGVGNVRRQTAWGRVDLYTGEPITTIDDERIVSHSVPVLLDASRWLWRTSESWAHGASTTPELGRVENHFSDVGDPVGVEQGVALLREAYTFGSESSSEGGAEGFTQAADTIATTTAVDEWGNVRGTCGGIWLSGGLDLEAPPTSCMRLTATEYDGEYDHLAIAEAIATANDGTTVTALAVQGTWDRGLGALLTTTDPNEQTTTVAYDGLGRRTALVPPPVDGCTAGRPTARISYELPTDPAFSPVSRMISTTETVCVGALGTDALVTIAFVDGLGRTRATLASGDSSSEWIRSGLTELNQKGEVRRAYQPSIYTGDPASARTAIAPASVPYTETYYDAFSRVRGVFDAGGALTTTDYHALSTDVCDPLDNETGFAAGTCTTARLDGQGRVIDQIQRNAFPDSLEEQTHRLWTWYRVDGVVTDIVRADTSGETDTTAPRPLLSSIGSAGYPHVHRVFWWDSAGRRIGTNDPDTDDPGNATASTRTWRYLFNRLGDVVAVRDPRGCGQNFFYDLAGRLIGEQYVSCDEAQSGGSERPIEDVPSGSIALSVVSGTRVVDVRYFYDDLPEWAESLSELPSGDRYLLGRATGSTDRGQRSAILVDRRGNAVWGARQMAVISDPLTYTTGSRPSWDDRPAIAEDAASTAYVAYDETHTYVRTADLDHANRGVAIVLPLDPDYGATAPEVRGEIEYGPRGLPISASVFFDSVEQSIIADVDYERDGVVSRIEYGDARTGHAATFTTTTYDPRRRPTHVSAERDPDGVNLEPDPTEVGLLFDQTLSWDDASNLVGIEDGRDPAEWGAGNLPRSTAATHDALYRVIGTDFEYESGANGDDLATDWRDEQDRARSESADPMDVDHADMLPTLPDDRARSLTWSWDWLGNTTESTDDQSSFYERSLGFVYNGNSDGAESLRPSAIYFAGNVPIFSPTSPTDGGSGWLEVEYGRGGNLLSLTVRAQCSATTGASECVFDEELEAQQAIHEFLTCEWACTSEQHYEYRWDELDRLAEARRWDRAGPSTSWSLAMRQRYRYDGANQRTVKQTLDPTSSAERIALYVYPGDFERRGLVRNVSSEYEAADLRAETQYVVAGARIVWQHDDTGNPGDWARNRRVTIGVGDLLGTTSAVIDLVTGELLETSTYYPSGARETLVLRDEDDLLTAPEPMGFTGKEADEEVGVTYFGERYLVNYVGRWATADPLHVHGSGGDDPLNAYGYVAGNLLGARDPLGLRGVTQTADISAFDSNGHPDAATTVRVSAEEQAQMLLRDVQESVRPDEQALFDIRRVGENEWELVMVGDGDRLMRDGGLSGNAQRWAEIISDRETHVLTPVPVMEDGPLADRFTEAWTRGEDQMGGVSRFHARYASGAEADFTVRLPGGDASHTLWGEHPTLGPQGPSFWASFREGHALDARVTDRLLGRPAMPGSPGDRGEAMRIARRESSISAIHEPWIHGVLSLEHEPGLRGLRTMQESQSIVRDWWRAYYERGPRHLTREQTQRQVDRRAGEVSQ